MGFHVCEYCQEETSSGDVFLAFNSGRTWMVPDMILHYVANHHYLPCEKFIDDVLHADVVSGKLAQTRVAAPIREGYLHGDFYRGKVPDSFFMRLWSLMRQAERAGNSIQTRGL